MPSRYKMDTGQIPRVVFDKNTGTQTGPSMSTYFYQIQPLVFGLEERPPEGDAKIQPNRRKPPTYLMTKG